MPKSNATFSLSEDTIKLLTELAEYHRRSKSSMLESLIWESHRDKFTSREKIKHSPRSITS